MRVRLADLALGVLREEHSAVTVRLKVDTDVVTAGNVVEVLDTSGRALNLQLQDVSDVLGASTVCVSSLDDSKLKVILKTSLLDKFTDESGGKSGDTIIVKKPEDATLFVEVVQDTVGITIVRRPTLEGLAVEAFGCTLAGLHKVSTASFVENFRLVDTIVGNVDLQTPGWVILLGHVFEELLESHGTDTVRAVNSKRSSRLVVTQSSLVRFAQLLVVSLNGDLSVRVRVVLSVGGASEVVQLRCGQDIVVNVLSTGSLESIGQCFNELLAGGTSVTSNDNVGRKAGVNAKILCCLRVCLSHLFTRCVGESGSIALPRLLQHISVGINELDTVVLCWVVGGSDHHADRLSFELPGTKSSKKTDGVHDGIQ